MLHYNILLYMQPDFCIIIVFVILQLINMPPVTPSDDTSLSQPVPSMAGAATLRQQQQAEDIAYTINHSLYCTLTDFLNPPINAATDGWLRWLIPGCGHDHSQDHNHHHDHHDHAHGKTCKHSHTHPHPVSVPATRLERFKQTSQQAFSRQRFIQYAKGEFIGDFGAVPITIMAQRFLPETMQGLRQIAEPLAKPLFTWGVERDSRRWAQTNSIAVDSDAYHQHCKQVYEYEMRHFPQAIVWTGASLGLNTAYQMAADKSAMPWHKKLQLKSTSVLSGVIVTAGVVVAARAYMPQRMHGLDQWMGQHAILPTTKVVGQVFGVSNADVDRMEHTYEAVHDGSWQETLQTQRDNAAIHPIR